MITLSLSIFSPASFAEVEPGVTPQEILLGTTYPQTGLLAGYHASYFVGVNAYLSYLNEQGGIYGRKIRLVSFDDRGVVTRSVQGVNQLILKDKVFALFSSTPSSAGHVAVTAATNLGLRGVPDLFPVVSWSGLRDSKKYPTTFILSPSAQQEARIIANFAKDEFPNLPFNAIVQDDDLRRDVKSAWSNIGYSVEKYFYFLAGFPYSAAIDEKHGAILFSSYINSRGKNINPLIARSDAVSSISRLFENAWEDSPTGIIPKGDWNNTFTGLYLPLPNDAGDEFVDFFQKLFLKYAPGQAVDAKTIEGANAAYVLGQSLAAVGPQPTRRKLIEFLRTKGNTLSHAGYAPLNFGNEVVSNKTTMYFARFDGSIWTRYSRNYSTELNSNIVTRNTLVRSRLLSNGLPLMSTKKMTITCTKGKLTKKVTAVKPKCSAGYKKK